MKSFKQQVDEFSRALLEDRLSANGGHILDTSVELGMTYRECRYQIKRLDLRARPHKLKDLRVI